MCDAKQPASTSGEDQDKARLYYEITRDRLANQSDLNREYGVKALSVLTLCVALVGATAVVLTLPDPSVKLAGAIVWLLAALSVCFATLTAFFSIRAASLLRWYSEPSGSAVAQHLLTYSLTDLLIWAGDTYEHHIERNKHNLRTKASDLQQSLYGLVLTAMALVSLALYVVSEAYL